MIEINLKKGDLNKIGKALKGVGQGKKFKGQVAAAINRAAKKTHSATSDPLGMTQAITAKLNMKSAQVKKEVKINGRATPENLTNKVSVYVRGRSSLIHFGARQTKKGVSYRIEKAGKNALIPSAFIQTANGGRQVFKRRRRMRYPIDKLRGISVWGYVTENNLDQQFQSNARKRLRIEMQEQIKKILGRWGKR